MTKISNQYSLTNILTADLANSRLGINNVSPTVALDVTGAGKFSSSVGIGGPSLGDILHIMRNGTTSYAAMRVTNSSSTADVYFGIGGSAVGNVDLRNNAYVMNSGASSLAFGTSDAVRMTITSGGNVGIGTTDIVTKLSVSSNTDSTWGNLSLFDTRSATAGVGGALTFNGYKISTTNGAIFAKIAGFKENSTSGNEEGTLAFYTTNPSAIVTERMRITSAGITTIKGDAGSLIQQAITAGSELYFQLWNSAGSRRCYIGYGSNNTAILDFWNAENGDIKFGTNNAERMRITSGGNVGIGTTTPAVKLQIDGTNAQERFRLNNSDGTSYTAFTEQEIRMWRPNDSGAAYQIATQALSGTWTGGGGGIVFSPLNTLRMTIGPTGNIGAPSGTNIYNASDARLKKNISKIAYGLDVISALNPVKFNWIDGFEPSEDGKYMLGFVAQEVLEILPEAVELFGGDINLNGELINNPLRVNEKFIIPVLVKAIQELSAKVSLLENK